MGHPVNIPDTPEQSSTRFDTPDKHGTRGLDGRWILGAGLLGYFTAIVVSSYFMPYDQFWRHFGVRALPPGFADLRSITTACESFRAGFDVWVANPADPWKRPFGYPPIWLLLAHLGLDQSHTQVAGFALAALFLVSGFWLVGRLGVWEGGYYLAIFASPVVMTAMERGNCDAVIFVMLCIVLALLRGSDRWHGSAGVLLFCGLLKVFPMFGWIALLSKPQKAVMRLALTGAVLFAAYLLTIAPYLRLIQQSGDSSPTFSYGSRILVLVTSLKLAQLRGIQNLDAHLANVYAACVRFAVLQFLVVLLGVYFMARRRPMDQSDDSVRPSVPISAFRLGAGIFLGTFLCAVNWDYRLMFLVMVLPQCLHWFRNSPGMKRSAGAALLLVLLTCNWHVIDDENSFVLIIANEAINWALAAVLFSLLLQSLPAWTRAMCRLPTT